jgi:hypothetical protein
MNSKGSVFGRARPPGAPKLLFVIAVVVLCTREAFAQTSPYPQPPPSNTTSSRTQPTNTAPTKTATSKTQTAKTQTAATQSKSHQAGKQYGHGHSRGGGVGFGVGATIDLGGIGQRRPEPNPFAVPSGPQPVTARTAQNEKPAPKTPREVTKTNPFAEVQLTGEQAKEKN